MGILKNLLEKKKSKQNRQPAMGMRGGPRRARGPARMMPNRPYQSNISPYLQMELSGYSQPVTTDQQVNYPMREATNITNPYRAQQINPYSYQQPANYLQYGMQQNQYYPQSNQAYPAQMHLTPYANPLLLQDDYKPNPFNQQNLYPLPAKQLQAPQQPSQFGSFINQFKSSNGSVDYNKMFNTAGQMMTAVNQVTGLIKGFGSIFKTGA